MKTALAAASLVLALVSLAFAIASAASGDAAEDIPAILPIPPAIKAPTLAARRDSLVAKRQSLRAAIENHRAECSSVEEGSAEDAACLRTRAQLSADRARHIADTNAFNTAVKAFGENFTVQAGARIGAAGSIAGDVSIITPDGRRIAVNSGTTLHLNDSIETGPTGSVQILLEDETVFTIGPNSKMILDTFVYDPVTGPGKLSARILKGIFRFVTGKIARRRPNDLQIHGPVGCFCIRGTDFEAEVKPDESGSLKVFSGEVLLKNKKTGIDSIVSTGQMISFDAAGTIKGPRRF